MKLTEKIKRKQSLVISSFIIMPRKATRTHTTYTMLTRGDRRSDRSRDRLQRGSHRVNIHATATVPTTVHATAVSPRIARIKHVSCD